jgi:hypothetical protein
MPSVVMPSVMAPFHDDTNFCKSAVLLRTLSVIFKFPGSIL